MYSPHENSQFSSQYDKDVQDLLKRLNYATSELQRVKTERDEVNTEVRQWYEEFDRRMLLMLHVDDQVYDALRELEAAKQKEMTLRHLIKSLNTQTREEKITGVSLSEMQKKIESLEKEKYELKVQCEQVKESWDNVQEI